ncbi:MAG: FAD-dependent oxidoreductase, partial [Candidatus Zixiibacteriota bacterium]
MTDENKKQPLPKKERLAIPRQKMPEQKPEDRVKNFEEVPYGLTPELAQIEASRCLDCKKPVCIGGCPVEVDIPGFIKLVLDGDYVAAAKKIKETNALPAICGRVCPQEDQCEKVCVLTKKYRPVAVGYLERVVADYERAQGEIEIPEPPPPTGKKVAVVGSGPAGLTVAADLAKLGHKVIIHEALHKAGGVLVYGIPEFRLPKAIVAAEVDYLKKLGVEVKTSFVVGKLDTVDELFEQG